MVSYNAGTTNPTLLNRLGDWSDHEAWVDFVTRYDPAIRFASRRYRLDTASTEELCQQVWIDLARRMRSYRYDPGKSFRAWLVRLCRSRAIDLLRKQKANRVGSLENQPSGSLLDDVPALVEVDESQTLERPLLLRQADEVQRAVRRRVDARTWQVFWNIAVEGQSVREVSESVGISYYAAFAAQKRVSRMLREEGRLLMAEHGKLPSSDAVEID